MDPDQAATVFVEMCTRLDELIEGQRTTNALLGGVTSALQDCLAAAAEGRATTVDLRPLERGLGRLIPRPDNAAAAASSSTDWHAP